MLAMWLRTRREPVHIYIIQIIIRRLLDVLTTVFWTQFPCAFGTILPQDLDCGRKCPVGLTCEIISAKLKVQQVGDQRARSRPPCLWL